LEKAEEEKKEPKDLDEEAPMRGLFKSKTLSLLKKNSIVGSFDEN
jgi:hypothetical protein